MKKKTKLNSLSELIQEIDAWMEILQDKKSKIAHYTTVKQVVEKRLKEASKKDFFTYSLNIDKKDYDKLEKAARKEKMSISKFIKSKYWEYFMQGGPNVYEVEYKYMVLEIANRPQSGATKSIAMALNYEENQEFNSKLAQWKIPADKKRDLMKFFITQFLYGSHTLKNNNMNWVECESSSLKSYAYNDKLKELFVMFNGGSVYVYYKVPKTVFYDLNHADSKGQFHNKFIINKYDFKKIK